MNSAAIRRLPRWLTVVLALGCCFLGLILLTRPLASLSTLLVLVAIGLVGSGVTDLVAARATPRSRLASAVAVASIVAGVAVLIWPGTTIRLLALVVGLVLVLSGVGRAVGGVRGGDVDERAARIIGAAAEIVVGLLALGWPDLTLLIVAVAGTHNPLGRRRRILGR